MSHTMRAVIASEAGGPEVLRYTEVERPVIRRPTDVLVRVFAAGVNPGDCQNRAYGAPSYAAGEGGSRFSIFGMDGVGVIEQVGEGITHLRPGDAVWYYDGGYANRHGSYAEYKVVDGRYVAHKPDSLDFVTAAALPVVGLTAWEAVVERAAVSAGQFVLVHGGAGGLGHIAIQLARERGARVAATVSSPEKARLARALGAELVLDYRLSDVRQAVAEWSGKDGADAVFDFVGRENFANSIELVAPYGSLVNTVVADWPRGDNMLAEYRNISIRFVNIGLPQVTGKLEYRLRQAGVLAQLARMVDEKRLTVHLDRVYPLREVAEAHRALEAGEIMGRVVVSI